MTDPVEDPGSSDEPDVLGAAATLDITGNKKRRQRRRARAHSPNTPTNSEVGRVVDIAPTEATGIDGYSGIVDVFEPHRSVTPPIRPYLASLWDRRSFLVELAKSRLWASRSSTALGSIWGILDPLFQAAIYLFLFTIIRGDAGRPSDFIFVLIAGILLFQLSSQALVAGGGSVRQSSSLMLNSSFPRALLPLASVYQGILEIIPALFVIALAQVILGAPTTLHLLWLPVLFTVQIAIAIGMALASAMLVVYFRDASNFMAYASRVLFFTTPVIYPYSLVEDFDSVLTVNPLYPLFVNYQKVFGGEALSTGLLGISVAWAVVLILVGGRLFLRREQDFASRL